MEVTASGGAGVVAAPPGNNTVGGADLSQVSLLPLTGEDGLMALFAFQSADRAINIKSASKQTANNHQLRKQALEKLRKAIAEAAEAKKRGGFWSNVASVASTVGKLAAVAGCVAAVVASGGAAAPVVALALSSGAFLQGETQIMQKLGMSDEAANWTTLGMSLAGGGVAGATTMGVGQGVAMAAQGTATATAGVATIQAGEANAHAQQKMADAEAAKVDAARMQRLQQVLLQALKDEDEGSERVLGSIRGSLDEQQRTLEACFYRRI